jgi:transcriptional regulator with XRE-family HTH domain
MTFSQTLSFHRARLGLSQAAVADLLQTPLRTFWGWESGRNRPNKITQQVAVSLLESLRSDFRPEAKRRQKGKAVFDNLRWHDSHLLFDKRFSDLGETLNSENEGSGDGILRIGAII